MFREIFPAAAMAERDDLAKKVESSERTVGHEGRGAQHLART
jgi:hypothetical protein